MNQISNIVIAFVLGFCASQVVEARCSAIGQQTARCLSIPESLKGWMPPREEFPRENLRDMQDRLERELDQYLADLNVSASERLRLTGKCVYKTDPNRMNFNTALLRLVTQLGEACQPVGAIKSIRAEKKGSYRSTIVENEDCLINLGSFDGTGFGIIEIAVSIADGSEKKITLPFDTKQGVAVQGHPISSLYWDHQLKNAFSAQFCNGNATDRQPSSTLKPVLLFKGKNKSYSGRHIIAL